MGAEALLTPDRLSVTPGGEATAEISVNNTGSVVDSFMLCVLGEAAEWAACEPQTISLFPGQTQTAQVVISPPMSPRLPYGPIPFGIRVASTEDPAGSVVEEGWLEVGELSRVTAELSPRIGRTRGMRARRYQIAVDNYGNAPAVVSLAGSDDADALEVRARPSELMIAPGASSLARVRVRARRRFWRGPKVTHRFQVTAVPGAHDPVCTDGTLIQRAVLPGWLLKTVALVAVMAVALTAVWLAVLRPVVMNLASNSAGAHSQHKKTQHNHSSKGNGHSHGSGGGHHKKAGPDHGAAQGPLSLVLAGTTGTFYGQAMTAGDIYTVAGGGGAGFSGDGGPATSAELGDPGAVSVDSQGNLVIADTGNGRIRVVAEVSGTFYGQAMTAGDIYTVAGGGGAGFSGDGGPATSAELGDPGAVSVDSQGNLVIADTGNGRIRVVAEVSGTFYGQAMTAGDIYTVAGGGGAGFSGDGGPATSAELGDPGAVSVDSHGNLVITEGGHSDPGALPSSG